MKQYYGRSTPSSQTIGKTNIITGEPIGESGDSHHQPPTSLTNSTISHGRGKHEAGDRVLQREKERKYKEELDRWVEQNKAHKAAEAGDNSHKQRHQPQPSQDNYGVGTNVGTGDAYSGTAYQKNEKAHMLDADERKKQQKELLEGYKAVMDSKKRQKDAEKERDKFYQRQQYEEILKQDYQREEHFRKLKSGGMQQDMKSRQQQNLALHQAGLEALDQEQARQAYEARQPARYGSGKPSSQPQSEQQHQPELQQHSYGGAGPDYQDYSQNAYDRAMMERGPSELNKQPQYEPHGNYQEQESPRRQEHQDEKGGWQYYEPFPENIERSPKKSEPSHDYGAGAGLDKKRGGTGSQQASIPPKMANRSAKDDYILNRQRYGNHGGFNIISHQ